MELVAVLGPVTIERALDAAARVGDGNDIVAGLAAPFDGDLRGRVNRAWTAIDQAIREIAIRGVESAQAVAQRTIAEVERLLGDAQERAVELKTALVARIQVYAQNVIDDALRCVRESLLIGAREMHLSRLEVAQKIVIGGSIGASLTELFRMSATGELTVNAVYEAPAAR